jgi:uncharacterized membrane protein YphA (DoxX/SURF4 family)
MSTESVSASPTAKSSVRFFPCVARVLLGLLFFVFGLDWFVHFMPQPKEMPPAGAMDFGGALMKTGYMMELVKGTEVIGGALLLANCFVPFALAILAPVIVNIVALNVILAPSGMGYGMSVGLVVFELYLAWAYRSAFRPMLACRVTPS